MKITFFIGSISGGGAERMTCNLANFLVEHGHEVTILTMSDVRDTYLLNKKIKRRFLITAVERKNFVYDNILRYKRLGYFMKTCACDCYVVLLPITIVMMLLQRCCTTTPIIASERNNPESYSRIMKLILKFVANKADAWVFQTEEALSWYDNLRKKKIIIPNAINPEFLKPLYKGTRKCEVVAVGRLDKQKNYELLIEAFAIISKKHPDYKLRIFGQGPKEHDLRVLVASLGLSDSIIFEGYVNDISARIEASSLYIMTSNYEGMPNSLMEAMALGIPCISTDCPAGGPKFLIQNGVNGILIKVNDRDSLVNSIELLLNDQELSKKMGENASKIRVRLHPKIIYGQWEQFLKETANCTIGS